MSSFVQALSSLEKKLSFEKLEELLKKTKLSNDIHITLPKFKLHQSYLLNSVLKELGIKDAFDPNLANFSKMTHEKKSLFMSKVFHKSFLEVNEEGTEAAAATGLMMGITSMPKKKLSFNANHPFLFFIREKKTGAILFIGRYIKPLS